MPPAGFGRFFAESAPFGALLAGQKGKVQSMPLVAPYTFLHDPDLQGIVPPAALPGE